MTWSTLRSSAMKLGFDVAYRSRSLEGGGYQPDCSSPPGEEGPWLCVGSYDQVAGVWVHPLTEAARGLSPKNIARAFAGHEPFMTPVAELDADFNSDFVAASQPGRLAAEHPDWGCMPA